MQISIYHALGQRAYQEDRFVCSAMGDGHLLAVFDGHGGYDVANQAASLLPTLFSDALTKNEPARALSIAFEGLVDRFATTKVGSTASAAYIVDNTVTIAVLGDSPVIALTSGGTLFIAPEHNVSRHPTDAQEIAPNAFSIKDGYVMLNAVDGLAVTRALGDATFPMLIRRPEVFEYDLGSRGIVIVATDGICPSLDSERHMHYKLLAETALEGSDAAALFGLLENVSDNVTILVAHHHK